MSRVLSRTLRGHAALRAAIAWFETESTTSYDALILFLDDLRARGSRRVYEEKFDWEERQVSYTLGEARFRPKLGDPDIDGDEGTFGFGDRQVSLDGTKLKIKAPGVLEMVDRWADCAVFGTHTSALFKPSDP